MMISPTLRNTHTYVSLQDFSSIRKESNIFLTTRTYLLIISYYPMAYRICMLHRIMHVSEMENYD